MRSRLRFLLTCSFAALALLTPTAAQGAPLKAPAKKFIAQHEQLNARFMPKEAQVLALIADKRKQLRTCSTLSAMPDDSYQQIISFLYVLLDLIQESAALVNDDLVFAANTYRATSYGDRVLNKAGHARYLHLKTLTELKPFSSCSILQGWAGASWPTDWKPKGEEWEAARAIYYPDLQIPDEDALQRRLGKLGASRKQRAKIEHVAVTERVLDAWDRAAREFFPLAKDIDWR